MNLLGVEHCAVAAPRFIEQLHSPRKDNTEFRCKAALIAALARVGIAFLLCAFVGCRRGIETPSKPQDSIRVTTWNLNWFPDGSERGATPERQSRNVAAAADVLRKIDPDILLLQEMRDYPACTALAEAIKPGTYSVAICSAFSGRQQVAILSKVYAQAAWAERWQSADGIDPPRGFAFAWFQYGESDIGLYCVHLKSNLIRRGDKQTEAANNIRKREAAAGQLLNHVEVVVKAKMPMIDSIVVGGDFNTNADQAMFASERTLSSFVAAGFGSCFGGLPLAKRVTHPANHGYPDATFDYLLSNSAKLLNTTISRTTVSDHFPVTCDIELVP